MESSISNNIIAASAVIGLLIGAVGGLSASRKNSIIKVLTQDNVATKDYAKTLEAENARITAERNGFKVQADTFREHAQGSPQLKALTMAVKNQTKVLSDYFKKEGEKDGRR